MTEDLAAEVNALTTVAVGEKAEVAHAVKAVGQHMQQEASDEFVRMKAHNLLAIAPVTTIILPAESDVIIVDRDDAAVGDGDTVGIATEIGAHLCGAAEGRLGIDDPVDPASLSEMAGESG